jgi:hypothetical protein
MDDIEQKLHDLYIESAYAYLRHIEPKRLAKINEKLAGKIKDPAHWRTRYEQTNPELIESVVRYDDDDKRKHKYNTLRLLTHPDKNPTRQEEAGMLFRFVQDCLETNSFTILEEALEAADQWEKLKELSLRGTAPGEKQRFVTSALQSRWFNWSSDDDNQWIDPNVLAERNEALKREEESSNQFIKKLEEEITRMQEAIKNKT